MARINTDCVSHTAVPVFITTYERITCGSHGCGRKEDFLLRLSGFLLAVRTCFWSADILKDEVLVSHRLGERCSCLRATRGVVSDNEYIAKPVIATIGAVGGMWSGVYPPVPGLTSRPTPPRCCLLSASILAADQCKTKTKSGLLKCDCQI